MQMCDNGKMMPSYDLDHWDHADIIKKPRDNDDESQGQGNCII
jgi:hypothetical protein